MPSYKLQYFDARGLVEGSRYLLALAGQDFEDARFPLNFGTPGDFSTITRPEFDAAKAAGELDASGGKVPYLQIDGGVKIGQSKAIERYLAAVHGFAGTNPIEVAQIDQVAETVRDVRDAFTKIRMDQSKSADEKAKLLEAFYSTTLPAFLAGIEKALPEKKSDFVIGEKVSLADVALFSSLADKALDTDQVDKALENCPRIKASVEKFGSIPEIQAWIAKRPDTMF